MKRGYPVEISAVQKVLRKEMGRKRAKRVWASLPACKWGSVILHDDELMRVSLIRNELNWLALGGFLREPTAAAEWILQHPGVPDDTRAYWLLMRHGHFPTSPVIMVGPPHWKPNQLVVVDGNHRVTAACMGGVDSRKLPVLVGTSKHIHRWAGYQDGKRIRKTLNALGEQRSR